MTLPLSLPVNSWLPRNGGRSPASPTRSSVPSDTYERLRALYPQYVKAEFAPHHRKFWEWEDSIEPGERPAPFVGIWARGGAKSTSAELAAVDLGARSKRRYCLYVSGTQTQADDHVGNVAIMLESTALAEFYPEMGERRLGKFGNSRGWRRNRLWTAHGYVVDAIGLDTAARGVKLEEQRPDLIILDDIDDSDDSPDTTRKKIEAITKRLIPAGAGDVAILAIQNLVIPNGVFAQLADDRADWLADRIVSGPVPALEMLNYVTEHGRHRITGGIPTWEGQGIERCQEMLNDMGLTAFLSECQHDVEATGDQLVYGRASDGVLIYDPARNRVPHPWKWEESRWRIGLVDPGGRDPTGLMVGGVAKDAMLPFPRCHAFAEHLYRGPMSASEIAEWFYQFGPLDLVMVDPSAATLIETLAKDYGFKAYPAQNARIEGVSLTREMLRTGRLTIAEGMEETHRQFGSYWMAQRPEGSTSDVAFLTRTPASHHADLLDLLRYFVMTVTKGVPRRTSAPMRVDYGRQV